MKIRFVLKSFKEQILTHKLNLSPIKTVNSDERNKFCLDKTNGSDIEKITEDPINNRISNQEHKILKFNINVDKLDEEEDMLKKYFKINLRVLFMMNNSDYSVVRRDNNKYVEATISKENYNNIINYHENKLNQESNSHLTQMFIQNHLIYLKVFKNPTTRRRF